MPAATALIFILATAQPAKPPGHHPATTYSDGDTANHKIEPWLSDCRTLSDAVGQMSDAVGGLSDCQMSDTVGRVSDACRTPVGTVGQCLTGKGRW